jgi:thioesterase domain-containing protein
MMKRKEEHLAYALERQANEQLRSPLVEIQAEGSKLPFFCVHPIGGNALCYVDLARQLGSDQPFYGLQAIGLDGESEPYSRIEDMAACYIEAMRGIQLQGPYILGGWSFGGIVAFEMAQQLQKQGHTVGLLALFDSRVPGFNNRPSIVNDAALMIGFAADLGRVFCRELSISYDHIQGLRPYEQLKHVLEQARNVGILPDHAGLEMIQRLLQIYRANTQALMNYVPQSYSGRITLFRVAKHNSEEFGDRTFGWGKLAEEKLDIQDVPGDHYTMLAKPNIEILAQQLKHHLDLLNLSKNPGLAGNRTISLA